MDHYESKISYPVSSPAVQSNEHYECLSSITSNGLGLVNPRKVFSFYDELHSYLASSGIDGVKVDVQDILETLGAGHSGRVQLARKYHQALEASIVRNFADNRIISCMSHNTVYIRTLQCKKTAVMRASDDFWPKDPASHTVHIASVAYLCSLESLCSPIGICFILHPMAEYHGAARAVGCRAISVRNRGKDEVEVQILLTMAVH